MGTPGLVLFGDGGDQNKRSNKDPFHSHADSAPMDLEDLQAPVGPLLSLRRGGAAGGVPVQAVESCPGTSTSTSHTLPHRVALGKYQVRSREDLLVNSPTAAQPYTHNW